MDRPDAWSVTDRELHDRLRRLRDDDAPAALATVVDVEASAYRRPGAKLVETADGTLGAITAGCLEGPVATLAAESRETGSVAVERYDMMDEDEWGLGMGCNGVIDVLVEPLDDSFDPALAAIEARDAAAVLTVIESADEAVSVGARTVLTESGTHTGSTGSDTHTESAGSDRRGLPADVLEDLRDAAVDARESGWSGTVSVERDAGDLRVFVDSVEPAPELLLFGSQYDVHAVAKLGAEVGFRVTVASARGARSDAGQFPHAHRVVATRPPDVADAVVAPQRTYAVLLSHNLVDDQLALEALLTETDVPYVGLMGPRKRFEEIREGLAEQGTELTPAQLDRMATPVGLDLGTDDPVGIALSVVAEAVAVANDATGGRLRDTSGPIHHRSAPTR